MKSVSELKKGDILTNTNHYFDIEIKDIGKKNTRYINLETGEKIKSFTSKFNFMLRKGVFIKKPSIWNDGADRTIEKYDINTLISITYIN